MKAWLIFFLFSFTAHTHFYSFSLHPLTLRKKVILINFVHIEGSELLLLAEIGDERNGDSTGCQKRLLFWKLHETR